MTIHVSPQALPALVLNADYRPLSYYPLSLWPWQDAIKAAFRAEKAGALVRLGKDVTRVAEKTGTRGANLNSPT